jgi:hypothetical protein
LRRSPIFRGGWALGLAATLAAYTVSITADRSATLARISAQSLKGHVSFLASDLLEGRGTPSRGLDVAAEYIAAQFRRIGLKPAGDDGYFQVAHFFVVEQTSDGAELTARGADVDLRFGKNELRIENPGKADFADVTPLKVDLKNVQLEEVAGKVIVAVGDRAGIRALRKLKPAAAILAFEARSGKPPESVRRLQSADQRLGFPIVRVYDEEFFKLIHSAKSGPLRASLSLRLPAPTERPTDLRNVAGILQGSDPTLGDTYILVTAHYDHLGMQTDGEGDRIFNGANDDASGVASVIEIASALGAARPGPRRSVLFMTYFGEEEGLLGSRYYGRHPLVPLKQTIANLNLEHLGRTDGDGRGPGTATMTGFGYSDITAAFKMAGEATGVKIYRPENNGDDFFARSDNQSLADQGVPDTTILTTFEFPDYHKVGDEWNKLDYSNLEKVDRAIALTVMILADDPQAPRWNEGNSKTERYVEAWRQNGGR